MRGHQDVSRARRHPGAMGLQPRDRRPNRHYIVFTRRLPGEGIPLGSMLSMAIMTTRPPSRLNLASGERCFVVPTLDEVPACGIGNLEGRS